MRRPKLSSVLSLTAIAVVAVVSIAYLLFGIAKVDWFTHRTSAVMVMPDAANLVERSPILLSGMKVGRVTSVRNTAAGVEVRFDIDPGQRIPADSAVVVESLSALGEPYIDFQPASGNGPYLTDGQLIHAQAVRTPKSIPEVARTVTDLLQQLDPQAIASLIQTFSQTLAGTETVIPQLTHASDLLAATLISRAPQIRELLTNAQVPGPDVAVAGAQMADGGIQFGEFGIKVHDVVNSLQRLLDARPVPDAYTNGDGLIPFLPKVTDYINRIGPDAQRLYPAVGPLLTRGGDALQGIDLSALIAQALAAVGPDGTVRLQINVK
ncbi:MCE family protein [Nocardia yunnanensis]|uniref:MCE family protein n=1 Tax=Nocardia yunnanensis TaxID=2382165 RepID=A0A386ZGW0_9NOCA|nr:MlaD family protein [Nocardia yunnanensis]AYF76798.1 MCE family protein [Nocardia yunnanensis]